MLLPVLPLYIVDFQVTGNGCANGWEKILLAKLREQSKSLQLVLYWIFQFGKAELDTLRVQRLVQFGECIAGGDVHAGDRLRRYDQPMYRRRRFRHGIQNALLEEFGVGEEQWRVPPKQDQSRDLACIRVPRDVVITFDPVGAAQYGRVRAPPVP